jgi:molybdenum cofactor cytidylyltransferase
MKFGSIPLADANGAILAHSLTTGGVTRKKGRLLSADDIAALATAGVTSVIAARLEAGDVHEDAAAQTLATACAGAGVRVAQPFTGRANLYAEAAGLLQLDAAVIRTINSIDEGLTLATLAANERVDAGQMIATVKVIPFAVDGAAVERAATTASRAPISVRAFTPQRVGLILTTLAGTKPSIVDKRRQVIEARLAALGATTQDVVIVAHTVDAVTAALAAQAACGMTLLLVFAASAIIDRGDVIPSALLAAGGRIERLGMPVDPGNLLLLGALATVPVVGIPSCAASPKLNGFDWVLERLVAGLPLTSVDISAMGVGGLLKEISTRPQPRDVPAPERPTTARKAARIAAVVLAAGRSTRMGTFKLLEPVAGVPLVRRTVEALLQSSAADVVVVTGNRAADVRAALSGLDVRFTENLDYADGISTSLKTGLGALGDDIDGALIALADMPDIEPGHVDRLIAAFAPHDARTIVVPTRHGKRGNPILWARQHFADMAAVTGDTGAKHLLGLHADTVAEVDLGSDAVLIDIDTPEALAALRARHGRR